MDENETVTEPSMDDLVALAMAERATFGNNVVGIDPATGEVIYA